jgi:hypothetical protein
MEMLIRSYRFAGTAIQFQAAGGGARRLVQVLFGGLPRDSLLPVSLTYQLVQEGGLYQVYRDGELEMNTPDEGVVALHLLERASHHFADRCRDGLVLHAACLAYRGKGLLLPGLTGCGKSTLAAWLVQAGFEHLTDELVYIPLPSDKDAPVVCQGLTRPFNLKPGGLALFAEASARARAGGDAIATSDGEIIPVAHFYSRALLPVAPLHEIALSSIVFPRYQADGTFQFGALSPAQTALRLMECLVNARNLPDHGLAAAAEVSRAAPGFELRYNRFLQVLPLIKEALGTSG